MTSPRSQKKRLPKLPIPTEHESQVAFFKRVALDPRTRDLPIFAIPNGGHRHIAVAKKMSAEGVQAGVPDICVAVPRVGDASAISVLVPAPPLHPIQLSERLTASNQHAMVTHGLFIEMKREGHTYPTHEQSSWIALLVAHGYRAEVCHGAVEAWNTLCEYLGIQPNG